jgi:hypothetical protein
VKNAQINSKIHKDIQHNVKTWYNEYTQFMLAKQGGFWDEDDSKNENDNPDSSCDRGYDSIKLNRVYEYCEG